MKYVFHEILWKKYFTVYPRLKKCFKCHWSQKGRLHLWIVFLVSFFSLLLWIPAEHTSNLKKPFNFNHRLRRNATLQLYRLYLIFVSKTTVMWVIFWNEDDICFIISDCRNLLKDKLKKLINKQITFYSPPRCNLPYYFSLQKLNQKQTLKAYKQANNFLWSIILRICRITTKCLNHHTVIVICSLLIWFNLQILNLC